MPLGKSTGIQKMHTQWLRGLSLVEMGEDGNKRTKSMSALSQNLDSRVIQVEHAEAKRNDKTNGLLT